MATGEIYAGFFPKKIIGATVMEDDIFGAVRQDVLSLAAKCIGECVIDPNLAGLGITTDEGSQALNDRRITVTGALPCVLGSGPIIKLAGSSSALDTVVEGARTITLNDPAWYTSLPYENANGTTYRVYLTSTEFPVDVDIASDGARGYGRWVGAPGVQVNPDTVTLNGGGYLELFVDTGLTALGIQRWLTANAEDDDWSYDVAVWLDTDQSGVEIATDDPDTAVVFGKLRKRSGDPRWRVSLQGLGDGVLGQGTPSTTAAHYKIAVLGPIVTTTNYDNSDDHLLVGTVASAAGSETELTVVAGQRVVKSMSSALLALISVPDQLLNKGVIVAPTFTTSTTELQITSAAQVYARAEILSASTQTLNNLGVSTTGFVYYDATSSVLAYVFTTSWDTANGSNCIPMWRVETDGAQNITIATFIGRTIKLFNEELTLTVSNSSSVNANFTTIDRALAFCAGLKASGTVPRRGIVIEIIGDVTQDATISDGDLLAVENVTFRGRSGGGIKGGNSVPASIAGSRIIWSYDGSLFTNNTTALMRNWRFEDITFRYATDATAATAAVISNTAGSIFGLTFVNCTFDGSNALNSVGGANGYLPHALYHAGVACQGVSFEGCQLHTAEAPVYCAAGATAPIVDLLVSRCEGTNDTGAMTFSQGGFIVDRCTAKGQTRWQVLDCKTVSLVPLQGPFVEAYVLKNAKIRSNDIFISGNFSAILLGNATTDDDVERVFITENTMNATGGTTAPVVKIITQDESATVRAVLFMSDNAISGPGLTAAGSVGVELNGGSAGTDGGSSSGIMIHDNVITNVETAVSVREIDRGIIHSNVLPRSEQGLISTSCSDLVVSHNVIGVNNAGAVGKGIESDAEVIAGNVVFIDGGTASVGIKATNTDAPVVMGNALDMDADAGAAKGIYMDAGGVCAANVVNDNASSNQGIHADANHTVLVGNAVLGAKFDFTGTTLNCICVGNVTDNGYSFADYSGVIVGNHAGAGNFDAVFTAGSFVGNVAAAPGDFNVAGVNATIVGNYGGQVDIENGTPDGTKMTIVGNVINDLDDATASADTAWVGNVFLTAGALTLTGDDGTFVANVLQNNLTFNAGADEWAIAANRVAGGTFTDNGTGNTVGGGNDI
jgi:hypothetical protein